MKTLLTALIVTCGAIVATPQASAAQFAKAAKKFGDFSVGQKFSFPVKEIVSAKQTLGGKPVKTAVPSGIPKFKKGQKVQFTIGKKGELTGKGFSIKFKSDGGTSNAYANIPSQKKPQADTGIVFKTAANKPNAVALTFFKVELKGFQTTTTTVHYTLQK